jgi:hypothetical protein
MKKILFLLIFGASNLLAQAQFPLIDHIDDTLGIWCTIGFEEPSAYISIGPGTSNLWQVGHPQKAYFNSAYLGSNAIITDTINFYPALNYSYFDLYIGNFNFDGYWFPWSASIEFRHKFDTDSLHDGGYISISWDKGQTWQNVIFDTIPWQHAFIIYNQGLYTELDTLYNGEHGFSGRSNGWIHSCITYQQIIAKSSMEFPPDTAILRFNFISDNNHNPHDGWMIDYIRLFSLALDGGIDEGNQGRSCVSIATNPFKGSTLIHLDKPYKSAKGELFTLDGRLIRKMDLSNKEEFLFERNNLKSGLYLLKVNLHGIGIVTRKLMLID